jgi:phosphate uptake regulator
MTEERRVQEVGGGTVTVSLPHDWAAAHGVTPGTSVYLTPQADGILELRPDPTTPDSLGPATIDLDTLEPAAAESLLRAAYRHGYRRIQLRGDGEIDDALTGAIDRRVRRLAGATITGSCADSITVEVLLDATAVSLQQSASYLVDTTAGIYDDLRSALAADAGASGPAAVSTDAVERKADLIARLTGGAVGRVGAEPPRYDRTDWRHLAESLALAANAGQRALETIDAAPDGEARATVNSHLERGVSIFEESGRAVIDGASEYSPGELLNRSLALKREIRTSRQDIDRRFDPAYTALELLLRAAGLAAELAAGDFEARTGDT